ncbi:hypothetical protein BJ912DRAFT_1046024, partial [Pholiota molesta]
MYMKGTTTPFQHPASSRPQTGSHVNNTDSRGAHWRRDPPRLDAFPTPTPPTLLPPLPAPRPHPNIQKAAQKKASSASPKLPPSGPFSPPLGTRAISLCMDIHPPLSQAVCISDMKSGNRGLGNDNRTRAHDKQSCGGYGEYRGASAGVGKRGKAFSEVVALAGGVPDLDMFADDIHTGIDIQKITQQKAGSQPETHMQPSITDHAHPIDGGCPLVTGRGSKIPACAMGGYPRTTAEQGVHGKDYIRTPKTPANEARVHNFLISSVEYRQQYYGHVFIPAVWENTLVDPRALDLIRRKNVADTIDGLHCCLEAKTDDIDGICSTPIFSFSRRSTSRIYQFDLAEGPEFESDLKSDKPFYASVYLEANLNNKLLNPPLRQSFSTPQIT